MTELAFSVFYSQVQQHDTNHVGSPERRSQYDCVNELNF